MKKVRGVFEEFLDELEIDEISILANCVIGDSNEENDKRRG